MWLFGVKVGGYFNFIDMLLIILLVWMIVKGDFSVICILFIDLLEGIVIEGYFFIGGL